MESGTLSLILVSQVWREVLRRDGNHPHISGFFYTELYDIEQELNGVYTYDRKLKFSAKI